MLQNFKCQYSKEDNCIIQSGQKPHFVQPSLYKMAEVEKDIVCDDDFEFKEDENCEGQIIIQADEAKDKPLVDNYCVNQDNIDSKKPAMPQKKTLNNQYEKVIELPESIAEQHKLILEDEIDTEFILMR